MHIDEDKIYSVEDVAKFFGVTSKTLRNWDKDGFFKPFMRTPGEHRRYLGSEIMKKIEEMKGRK